MAPKRTILITGGAGFIGSHVVRLFVTKYPDYRIVNLDKLTYAGNLANLRDIEDSPNYVFEKGDICDLDMLRALFGQYDIDGVIHLAAESHVDRSIRDPFTFARTNVLGTLSLLEAAREYWDGKWEGKLFYHISTDEVYGALELTRPEGDASGGEVPETNGVPELGSIPDRTGDTGADKGSGSISGQSVPGHMKHRDQVMPGN